MSGVKGRSGGHNRKTNQYKLITGRNKQRINADAPDVIDAPLMEFDGLGEYGQKLRAMYYEMLKNNGTFSATDSPSLHLLCNAAEQWHKADADVKKAGRKEPVYDGEGKLVGTRPSGLHKVERDLHASYMQLLAVFGFDPIHRDDIKKIATGKKINPFAGKL
jgi:phage terminase small subunit